MKKLTALILMLICVMGLTGCGKGETHTIEILIPAGSTEAFAFSEQEVSPQKGTLKLSGGAGLVTAQVTLKATEGQEEVVLEPVTLKQRDPVKFKVEQGGWYQIGIAVQNPSDTGMVVAIQAENVKIRMDP